MHSLSETNRENKFLFYDSVAQLVEQYTFNVWVLGSSPNGITSKNESLANARLFCFRSGNASAALPDVFYVRHRPVLPLIMPRPTSDI